MPGDREREGLPFSNLVVEFAREQGASALVKGLRAVSDFEWEFQMHHLNKGLAPDIETVYLMSSQPYSFVSSSGVKEIAEFGGPVDELVPPNRSSAPSPRDTCPLGGSVQWTSSF